MRSRASSAPEGNGQDLHTGNPEGMQRSTSTDNISNRVIRSHLVEVDMGTMYLFFRRVEPKEDPSCHGECFCRDMGYRLIESLHDLSKSPVYRCCMRVHFQCPDSCPGNPVNAGLGNDCPHCPCNEVPVRSAIQQGTRDHVACSAVERIENEESHYQYL